MTGSLAEVLSVRKGCCNEAPQVRWLMQQNSVVLQFWRLEVQGPGVGRDGSPVGVGEALLRASPPASGGWQAVCGVPWLIEASPRFSPSPSPGVLPLCVCQSLCLNLQFS